MRRLVTFILVDQPLTIPCRLQQNGAAILVRGLATHQTQFFEPVEILAARSGRNAEATRKFTHLEIGVRGDELQKAELRSGETGPANPVEKTLLEELAQEGSQDMSGPQEAIKIIARWILIPEAAS
jgi:hypothetical protein